MGWSTATLTKLEGLMGIRNSRIVQITLMIKNILVALNIEDKHWVHISNLKYGILNLWASPNLKNVSWFYRGFRRES